MTEDQRFVDGRPDVLTWQTAPLVEDVTIAGDVTAHLFAATTGSDADWVVKLLDVYPDSVAGRPELGGYELMLAGDIMRGRYRRSWEHPEAIPPNAVEPYTVDLHQQLYTFRRGHRIMVQVQSTWFPLYDRNPQTFVPNIFEAPASAYRAQTHRIYRTAARPSGVEVMVLPR
jgi:putative CocE/NonD family hydrolase